MFGSAPPFWWLDPPGLPARLLAPLGTVYGAIAGRRMRQNGRTSPVPVLCIGNFTAGGAGKTPTALDLARRLQARGLRPAFLSRGHGRRVKNDAVIAVDPARHAAHEVGDEPLLLARVAPTFVAADRVKAAERAVGSGAAVLIMDDGFQNPALRKTASIVVTDGETGIGNGFCMPAGPLRAPLASQWPGVSLLCVIGSGARGEKLGHEARDRGIPVARARIEPDLTDLEALRGRRLIAFSGIGRPAKFFDTLRAGGLDVIECRAFPDHHVFDAKERDKLFLDARRSGADLVTTEKDKVRLPASFECHVLPVRMVFEDGGDAVEALLDRILVSRS